MAGIASGILCIPKDGGQPTGVIVQVQIMRLLKPFVIPLLLHIVATIATYKWGYLGDIQAKPVTLKAFIVIFPLVPYLLFLVSILVGIRSQNAGIVFSSILIMSGYAGIVNLGGTAPTLALMIAFLLPVNIFLWGSIGHLPLFSPKGLGLLVLLSAEMLLIYFLGYVHDLPDTGFSVIMYHAFPAFTGHVETLMAYIERFLRLELLVSEFPSYVTLMISILVCIVSLFRKGDDFFATYVVTGIVVFNGIACRSYPPSTVIYFTTCGLILIFSVMEYSFYVAYIDELTNLPGRRSLNQFLIHLGKRYSIAMIDIDFYKRFNDTYGHNTGDQVLRMVAQKLAAVPGGAKVFRYGGEEFTAIFPGSSARRTFLFMENFRRNVESSPFVIRNKNRYKTTSENRGGKADADKDIVTITVSVGVASSGKNFKRPETVIKIADEKLYRAKEAGRNIVIR